MQTTTLDATTRTTTARLWAGYEGGPSMPLGGYAALMTVYLAGVGTFLGVAERRLPTRISAADFALLTVATHKIARIVARDWVTAPLRAPFTRYQESLGAGEVAEISRGKGLRRAIGDLLTCPFCFAPWVAFGLAAGFVVRPRATRLVAALFTAVTASDFLNHLYSAAKKLPK